MILKAWVLVVIFQLNDYETVQMGDVTLSTEESCRIAELEVRQDLINRNGSVITSYCFKR